jgi:hypothetical protein
MNVVDFHSSVPYRFAGMHERLGKHNQPACHFHIDETDDTSLTYDEWKNDSNYACFGTITIKLLRKRNPSPQKIVVSTPRCIAWLQALAKAAGLSPNESTVIFCENGPVMPRWKLLSTQRQEKLENTENDAERARLMADSLMPRCYDNEPMTTNLPDREKLKLWLLLLRDDVEDTDTEENRKIVKKHCICLKATLEQVRGEPMDVVQLTEYFHEKPYCGPTGDKLYGYLVACLTTWKCKKHYAPAIAILQASGMGKSRTVRKLVTKGPFVMYASFASKTMSPYPLRSPFAAEMTAEKPSKHHAYAYVLTHLFFFSALVADGRVSQTAVVRDLSGEEMYFGAKLVPMFHRILNHLRPMSVDGTEFVKLFANTVEHYVLTRERGPDGVLHDVFLDCQEIVERYVTAHPDVEGCNTTLLDGSSLKIVFAFDEASGLVTNDVYGNLRRALRLIKDGVFGVFLDTHSSVQQFAPSVDPSKRTKNLQIFSPYIGIDTFDVYAPNYESDDWQEKLLPKYLYQFGQPLWKSMMNPDEPEDLIEYGMTKLMFGRSGATLGENSDTAYFAAVIGARVPLEVEAVGLANELTAGHMAPLCDISTDRTQIRVEYASEPIMAASAAHLMEGNMKHILAKVYDLFQTKSVSVGDAAELVAMMLLQYVKDQVANTLHRRHLDRYTRPITVRMFLLRLFPKRFKDEATELSKDPEWRQLLDGTVTFSHFIRLADYFPTPQDCEQYYFRTLGVMCQKGQQAVDLLVPVRRDDGTFTMIAFQVRNRAKASKGDYTLLHDDVGKLAASNSYQRSVLFVHMEFTQGNEEIQFAIKCDKPYKRAPRSKVMNKSCRVLSIRAVGCSSKLYPIQDFETDIQKILEGHRVKESDHDSLYEWRKWESSTPPPPTTPPAPPTPPDDGQDSGLEVVEGRKPTRRQDELKRKRETEPQVESRSERATRRNANKRVNKDVQKE